MKPNKHRHSNRRVTPKSHRRQGVRETLRQLGCTCDATLTPADGHDPRLSPTDAECFVVAHKPGCRLGDAMKVMNDAGFLPSVYDMGNGRLRWTWGR